MQTEDHNYGDYEHYWQKLGNLMVMRDMAKNDDKIPHAQNLKKNCVEVNGSIMEGL